MDAETKLAAAWAADLPPAHDPNFTLAVMERVERRRMWRQLLDLAPLVVVAGVLAWALAPTIETLFAAGLEDANQLATTGFLMVASLFLGVWLAMGGSRAVLD